MLKEACVETFEEAKLAEQKGANRIELCSDLANDGLTPTSELMNKTTSKLKIPVMVMIRPLAGNFIYSKKEIIQMKSEIDQAKKAGATGVVFGLLTSENTIDIENTRILAEYSKPLPVTFHKAIDELESPVEGVSELLQIENIKRILTSGGKPTALEGQETIRKMIGIAGDKITILVAGKVLDSNIEEIQKLTGADELHGRRIVGELLVK
ncbi:MAG: copper homeostasis protein CutC [Prolixibacteraceae bacterium]|jgi:copper homeostasis protein|nr:copper homeostasis protein CutC [Prolixibacteraceae bacterium]MBT6005164.1 copper homeostasis protein CutC [Prolixibacteraceae bacterium]MBT6998459.1 copper homeostasis protein CutC [Prolixibacteraceae bacterium]MBT7394386.1 copper homeostasis protein CutC [Prolixibacteraceae bacterium]